MNVLYIILGLIGAGAFIFLMALFITVLQHEACQQCPHKKICDQYDRNKGENFIPPCHKERMMRIDNHSNQFPY